MRTVPFHLLAFAASLSAIFIGVFIALSAFRMVGSASITAIEWGFIGAALTFWIPGTLSPKRSVSILCVVAVSLGLLASGLAYMWADLMASV